MRRLALALAPFSQVEAQAEERAQAQVELPEPTTRTRKQLRQVGELEPALLTPKTQVLCWTQGPQKMLLDRQGVVHRLGKHGAAMTGGPRQKHAGLERVI